MGELLHYTARSSRSLSFEHNGSAWGSEKNPAAFDFRSDVHTTPTMSMLKAIQECSLLDDVTMEDPTTLSLERFVADLTGKEEGLLVLSGTMGNQVAFRAHLSTPPHAVIVDRRGHIVNYEAGGVATLSQAMVQALDAKNGRYLTLEDIKKWAVISDDVHACPTRLISLENTLNGAIMPLSEVKRICGWARENGITMHLDGARLWEAVAAGAGTLKEFCAEFDSISLCISKGLGAPIGSVLVGTKAFIKRSRWIRKSIGGGLRQAGVVAAPMRVAIEETFLGGKLEQSHKNAKRIAKMWTDLGGTLQYPVDTNMVWLDLEAAGVCLNNFIELAEKYGLRVRGGRFVVHYQIGEEAIAALQKIFTEVLTGKDCRSTSFITKGPAGPSIQRSISTSSRPASARGPPSPARQFHSTTAKMVPPIAQSRTLLSSHPEKVRMLVLETDETHPDSQEETSSFGVVLGELLKKAGDEHDPSLGIETAMQYVVEPDGGVIPKPEEISEDIHAILITGSCWDAHGDDPWILKLMQFIRDVWINRPDIRFTGICFGHQILCRTLGATVKPQKNGEWELSHQPIYLSNIGRELFDLPATESKIHLHQMHLDHVVNPPSPDTTDLIPKGTKVHVWGTSEHTGVQGVYIQKRLFTTQGHMEFDEKLVKRQLQMRVDSGSVDKKDANGAAERADWMHDGLLVAKAVLRFFHGDDDKYS
ncbi:hypothetical protein TW65_08600 [Stemphylium lycopersici]|uniref:Uncharacterized protein n=1 Tax=Stemphylium lycopersici TaxID=183478 RepID=A0A364NFT0_STELY|nr:hypothetical protein TW65_08600 [Stemphylium lycopersici]RAR16184.1 hypothetical protein DDE83_000310 [Stemphylium lycopersici]